MQLYNIRNKVISHDEYNFNDNCVGITVDIASGRAVDITDIAALFRKIIQECSM